MVASLGQIGMAAAVYCGVAAMMLFRFGVAVSIVLAIATLVVVSGEAVPGWDRSLDLAFATCAAGLAVFGISSMMRRNIDLIRAHEENAELLVENERTRFARDLHDILGHSLTVITVKAELAGRLMDTDPARAKAEVADLERLSRDALADVRRAVEGYRDLTLPGELARARAALEAAEIRADLPNTTDEVPTDLRELFAWAVREGVTNVVRHSHATTCRVVIGPTAVEVTDDGEGATGDATGSGLRGLRERAAAVGATVRHPVALSRVLPVGRAPVTIRLLIADDQALVRGAIAALLGLEPDLEVVAEVGSGDAAVDAAVEHFPDVALLDVEMPGLDGIEAARVIRERSPGTRVLMVTTFGRPGYLKRALTAGASGFVVKETPAAQLADAVRRVHQGLRVVDPALAMDSLTAGDSPLTTRETEVLQSARDGASVAVIASRVHLSEGTVRNHLSSAIGKTGAANRAEAVLVAVKNGWL